MTTQENRFIPPAVGQADRYKNGPTTEVKVTDQLWQLDVEQLFKNYPFPESKRPLEAQVTAAIRNLERMVKELDKNLKNAERQRQANWVKFQRAEKRVEKLERDFEQADSYAALYQGQRDDAERELSEVQEELHEVKEQSYLEFTAEQVLALLRAANKEGLA
jgi:chromosome segregation ATPase